MWRAPSQVKGATLLARRSADMDADPPRFEARRATSWLVLFMTHVASCGAGTVIKNAHEPGAEFIDATDADFRQKLAMRLGMARHSADAEAIQATREAGGGNAEAGSKSGSGSTGDDETSCSSSVPQAVLDTSWCLSPTRPRWW